MMTTDLPDRDFIYDYETYLNMFSAGYVHVPTRTRWIFEVSPRRNQCAQFVQFIYWLRDIRGRAFGFNNEGFDCPVAEHLVQLFETQGYFTALDAWRKAQEIINPALLKIIDAIISVTGRQDIDVLFEIAKATQVDHRDRALVQSGQAAENLYGRAPEVRTSNIAASVASICADDRFDDRFGQTVWPDRRTNIQGDLYKIRHFDNQAKRTSLKKLEIAMRSQSVVDLPYKPWHYLTSDQADEVITYMCHDISETLKFYLHTLDQIKFRDQLAEKYPDLGDVLNFNDTKIGKKFFERELENNVPGICYTYNGRKRVPNQSHRPTIALGDVLSPKVGFDTPEFSRILGFFNQQVITRTKGFFSEFDTLIYPDGSGHTMPTMTKGERQVATAGGRARLITSTDGKGKVAAHFAGIDFIFGLGGIHGSLHATTVRPDDHYDLIDVDVASYYPNLAISNGFYPEHLSDKFCEIYSDVYNMRRQYGKKTAENAMFKLALNGVYGDSGNTYSPFYDPKYMMSITINGQLFLCMLAEWATYIGCKMVQVNTDGITCLVPRAMSDQFTLMCNQWESHTGLELEHLKYSAMHIRDVNSYIAEKSEKSHKCKETGQLIWEPDTGDNKRIGAYGYVTPLDDPFTREREWHKDHSMLVVRKAAEAKLTKGRDIAEFIQQHRDPFDFMLSVKVPGNSSLEEHWPDGTVRPTQSVCRYYVSTRGCQLVKVMPPLKGNANVRHIGIEKGWTVKVVNDADLFDWSDVNWLYYIEEAKKLTSWVA